MAAQKKDWKEYLLWGLALLVAGGAGVYIYNEEKKKKTAALPPVPHPTTPTQHAPIPPPPLPPAAIPFGQGGQPVLYTEPPQAGIAPFDTLMSQATGAGVHAFTINTTDTSLFSHTQADINAPHNGSFARGAQVASTGEPMVVSADGRHWLHVMGQDAATGAPLLGWVDSSYLLGIGG